MRIDSVTDLFSRQQIEVSGQKQQDRTAAQNPTSTKLREGKHRMNQTLKIHSE